ncbi:lipoprotein NlpI [compost metagenome]
MLYLGRTDINSVMAAATDRDAKIQREQRCEANFYVAHWHLIRNNRDLAVALLKDAQADCPKDFMEYEGAVAELRRLGK